MWQVFAHTIAKINIYFRRYTPFTKKKFNSEIVNLIQGNFYKEAKIAAA